MLTPPPAGPKRVFVVDDNRDAADTLGMFLEMEGYEVRVAYDGDEAIRESDDFKPDVALLDIGLPGADGYEVARHIREEQDGNDVLLIAVTGYTTEADVAKSREAGFDYHFAKPPDLRLLLRRIQSAPPRAH